MNTTQISVEEKEAWLAARKLGSSDAAAALGLNPFKSPYQLWAEKTGRLPAVEENEAMRWGKLLEPVIAHEFARRVDFAVIPAGGLYVHPEHEWMTATPDFFAASHVAGLTLSDDIPVEVKNVSHFQSDKYDGDGIPDHVHVQLLHQMAVLGSSSGYVVALLGGNNLVWRKVETTDFDWLIQAERAFWQYVETDTPPPLRAGDGDVLAAMYPESIPEQVELTQPEAVMTVDDYIAAKANLDRYKKEVEKCAAKLKSFLGENERAVCGDYRICWPTIESRRLDSKALEAAHPDIVAQFRKPSTCRRFEVKPLKNEE